MKLIFIIVLFISQHAIAVESNLPPEPKFIFCKDASSSSLEIEIDKYESLPPLSEIKLFIGKKIYKTRASKALISLETDPPQFAYKFILPNGQLIDYLQVNLTYQVARVIYKDSKGHFILIDFKNCSFTDVFSAT